MSNDIRDSELIGMFADAIEQDGIVTVLSCLCDGITATNKAGFADDRHSGNRRLIIAHFLLLEALRKIEDEALA